MDGSTFDRLTQAVSGSSRRIALRTALGGAAAATAGVLASAAGSDAKKKKKCKKKKCPDCPDCPVCVPTAALGEACETNEDCCANETNLACAITNGVAESAVCCGASGAACAGNDDCCLDLTCEDDVCQFVVF